MIGCVLLLKCSISSVRSRSHSLDCGLGTRLKQCGVCSNCCCFFLDTQLLLAIKKAEIMQSGTEARMVSEIIYTE